MILTRAFWKATAERAISTAAQAALLAWGGGTLPNTSLPWWAIPAAAGAGAALTVLKCLVAERVTNGNGPGFTEAETTVEA
jgi:hypothetical protein